jgi:hypothetical protein
MAKETVSSSGAQKQNKGIKGKEIGNPRKPAGEGIKPKGGQQAIEMRGTFIHGAHISGVTRPTADEKGSHDHTIKEHADHSDY